METLEQVKTHQKYSGYEKIEYIRIYPIVVKHKQMQYENESDGLNKIQTLLYKRAIFGIGVYDKKALSKISLVKLKRINQVSNRAQEVLNLWKQELIISSTNRLLENFPNSSLAQAIIDNYSIPDSGFTNRMDFKIFGINKNTIINKLILEKILPFNFYELKDTIIRSRTSLHLL